MKTMPKSTKEEKFRWIKPILEKDATIKEMVRVYPFSERSLKYWLANYRKYGMDGLENKSTRPKTNPNETSIRVKERIIELRKENNLCSQKLLWKLEKENIDVCKGVIDKVIKKEGLTRKYKTRKIHYNYVRVPLKIGELVEIDVKWVPGRIQGERYYQFTAIDCASRWRYLSIYEDISNYSAISFLKELINVSEFKIQNIKTDNGSCFTNRYTGYRKSIDPMFPRIHDFDLECKKQSMTHYLIDPGKPQQNGKVERSHRSDQETFYNNLNFKTLTLEELKYQIRLWNNYYNNLEHCSLNGETPNNIIKRECKMSVS
jgi:transposase InsO family protein